MDAAQHVKPQQVVDEASESGPYRFDRRRSPRVLANGHRLAVVFGAEGGRWLMPLDLRDTSTNGVGLVSSQALEAGDRVTLYDEGRRATFVRGVVTRCQAREDGRFDLGVTY